MKKLVIYWGSKTTTGVPLFFKGSPATTELFTELLERFSVSGIETYFCRSPFGFLGKNRYFCEFKYEKSGFTPFNSEVIPDNVWDKSMGSLFPVAGQDENVVNSYELKGLESNKWFSYLAYPDYFTKTIPVDSKETLLSNLGKIETQNIVLKPMNGFGGKGVVLINRDNPVIPDDVKIDNLNPHIIQEFMETDVGISGIVNGKHDLRLVCLNGKVINCFLRTPKQGDFRSNWAQGGTFNQVVPNNLPNEIIKFVKPIINDLTSKYNNPLFAIDIANTTKGYRLIELTGSGVSFADAKNENTDYWFNQLVLRFS